jgi:hypothetical protein
MVSAVCEIIKRCILTRTEKKSTRNVADPSLPEEALTQYTYMVISKNNGKTGDHVWIEITYEKYE